ncbi:hypothetical protein [Microlunatus speluncae]|uniref:hypothetical protein n=1 Tax=Microlunatus speluncae TaxID=2594267 RepID=UPI001C2DB7CF|nr:hypothetical protein [Microlunatus speluncae]
MRTSANDPAVLSPAVPSPDSPSPEGAGRGRRRAGARGLWWAVRIVATLHGVAVIGQPTLAGAYLGGNYDMLVLHARGADLVTSLSFLQLILAVLLWILGGPRWPTLATLLLVTAETAQYFAGLAGALELHVPLGVGVVTGSLFLMIFLWWPATSRSLSRSKGKPHDQEADR